MEHIHILGPKIIVVACIQVEALCLVNITIVGNKKPLNKYASHACTQMS